MTDDGSRNVRQQYASLIETLMARGEHDRAKECAEMAVRHGIWCDPRQRPIEFDPELPRTPVYDARQIPCVSYLEDHFAEIREEVRRVAEPARAGFSPVEERLVGRGRWDEVIFYEDGIRMEGACARFPRTAAIMADIPEAIRSGGVVMLSWLHPGTHIVPHCGATNTKLRVHLGIRVPAGATMRVGDTRLTWEEGRCLVFDDSFEHEVWNTASEPRVVLLFDIIHPALPAAVQAARQARETDLEQTVRTFLTSRGIGGVERDPDTDELTVIPDTPTTLTITRYMKDHDVTRIRLVRDALLIN